MSDVVLFHHALGLTPGLEAIAEELQAAGHRVAMPDLFDGAAFDTVEAGVAHAEQVGFDTIIDRGMASADELGEGLVVVGFSLGVLPAQKLAQTRPGVAAAVLCHGAIPLGVFADTWPAGVAVQLHLVESDPFAEEDLDAARAVADAATAGELFLYPGTGHLVADHSSPDWDPVAGGQIIDRIVDFLDDIPAP